MWFDVEFRCWLTQHVAAVGGQPTPRMPQEGLPRIWTMWTQWRRDEPRRRTGATSPHTLAG